MLETKLLFWTPLYISVRLRLWLAKQASKIYKRGWYCPEILTFICRRIVSVHDDVEWIFRDLTQEDDIMGKIFGIRPDQVHEFEPKGQNDIPLEERTVFLVSFLDVKSGANITDQVYSAKGFGAKREELLRAGTQELSVLRKCLKGWKNFTYEDGAEIAWTDVNRNESKQKQEATMDLNLGHIHPEQRGEIADFVRGSSTPDSD